jgi:hypothetical protein
MVFAALLLAIVITPPALELCAKERRRSKPVAAQQQPDARKAAVSEKTPAADKTAAVVKDSEPKPDQATKSDNAQGNAAVARKVDESARPAAGQTQPKSAIALAIETARDSRDAIRKMPAYTCTFSKQEQLKKGPPTRQTMALKFRREPFSVYLKYVDPNAGREVIYVEGRNNGKLHVHEASGLASLIGTITLMPTCNEAMKDNKYPLTMIGMEKMLDGFIVEWEEAQKHSDTRVQHYPLAKIGETPCLMYEVTHPQQREPFKFHIGRVYFDKKTLLPIRAEHHAFPAKSGAEPQLVEEYSYIDVKPEASLAESDFDVKNEKYGFR